MLYQWKGFNGQRYTEKHMVSAVLGCRNVLVGTGISLLVVHTGLENITRFVHVGRVQSKPRLLQDG